MKKRLPPPPPAPPSSKGEGCARLPGNEFHFRRKTHPAGHPKETPTTNDYAMSGLGHSAKAFPPLAGLHPNLATGFHHLATARNGSFQTWRQVHQQHERDPVKYQIGSTMAAEGCPCCNKTSVADSLGHYIFECSSLELTQIRNDLRLHKVEPRPKALLPISFALAPEK